ncbi:signal-transduction protein [Candidatus Caldarchaeum subterraneum]|uniref:Signal-transduction protein n=1 Tax=Caldiarchaeum subterraneum TaxID=311458 RepID=E6N8S8_CALS0|nr:signal-transduction protein [Candidatus Caldarchaeum subterraneum]BAJ48728.1 signal-transduction protein [Candidatus Caldarchaeum subterraneum]BAJ51400.1 signal-transduction protein [Candidatus Caldarchaeum subterraneum]
MAVSSMLVKDVMTADVVTVSPTTSVYAAAKIMAEEEVGSLVVTVGEKPVGVLTERDVVRRVVAAGLSPRRTSVEDVMTSPVVVVGENTSLEEAVAIMASNRVRRLLVVRDEKLVGIVTVTDIVRALGEESAKAAPAILRG